MTITNPTPEPRQQFGAQRQWGGIIALLILLLIVCAWWIVSLYSDPGKSANLHSPFIAIAAVLTGFSALAGYLINGRIDGILIDDRNRISLSRLQWVAWLIVLLGGYYTEAIWNMVGKSPFPNMQPDLWALLGIVSGSAVASNLIVDKKKTAQQPTDGHSRAAPAQPGQPDQIGSIDRNVTVGEASWADLFMGEEAANRDVVDISRLQQLVITVLLVVSYAKLLWDKLGIAMGTMDMPEVSNGVPANGMTGHGFLWLLGISHGAYLAYKATPKSGPVAMPTIGADASPSPASSTLATAPPAPLTSVPVRLAIAGADGIRGLQLTMNTRSVAVPTTGFVELSLEAGVAQLLQASGTRTADNRPVSGQLTITPTANDLNHAYELALS
jgi:hypothetical protein